MVVTLCVLIIACAFGMAIGTVVASTSSDESISETGEIVSFFCLSLLFVFIVWLCCILILSLKGGKQC